jgi:hypothetical protein
MSTVFNNFKKALANDIENHKQDLYQTISDVSKDIQGFRARYTVSEMSLKEVTEVYDYWMKRHQEYWDQQGE